MLGMPQPGVNVNQKSKGRRSLQGNHSEVPPTYRVASWAVRMMPMMLDANSESSFNNIRRPEVGAVSCTDWGTRDFIEQHYVELKKANPEFPILIRECSGVQPKLWARYDFGKETNVSLNNLNVDQVARALESVVTRKP
uniref:NADH dehydrogenase [ubiquinone] 1 alpha subcomplex subunit 2 n=2 Tax=Xenopus tropicalis TaxID=8364 RepID=A0A6I8S7T3_XENTR